MIISDRGLVLIKKFEGFKDKAYQDIVGIWTIGYGSIKIKGRKVLPTDTVTEHEAEQLIEQELAQDVYPYLYGLGLNQNQFDALCSFIYNLGATNFNKSTLKKKLLAEDYVGASFEFIKWNKAGGNVVDGLTKRRLAESKLFTSKV